MSPREIEEINGRLTHLSSDYGYNLKPARKLTLSRACELKVRGKSASLRFKVNRYGWPLVIQGIMSQLFGAKSWQARVAAAREVINLQHLK